MSKGFLKFAAFLAGATGAGMLVYGALVESNNLVVSRSKLKLRRWPIRMNGYRVCVLADLHLRDVYSVALAQRAIAAAIAEEPDVFVFPGDIIAYWKEDILKMVSDVLEPLRGRPVLFATGNHEFDCGQPAPLLRLLEDLGFKILRNQSWFDGQVTWVGIDSAKANQSEPKVAMDEACGLPQPRIVIWHEPDMVDELPGVASLMLSGHSHGGQFLFPGGFAPMHTKLGKKYPRGFYPDAPTPLYVSRGIGTTGPPSRLNCPPELAVLTLEADT